MKIDDKSRAIPSLDGMRAISIMMVVAGHSSQQFAKWVKIPLNVYLHLAHTGVSVFFVISGFLITTLLLNELKATGKIDLKRFYLRRAFRIAPPYYCYLGIMLALTLAGIFHTPVRAFFFAAVYLSNYYLGPGGGFVGLQHTWSLSVEEQFYLIWPATLVFCGTRNARRIALILIAASPFSRIATYLILTPAHRAVVDRMLHSSIDTIMFGCVLAILWENKPFNRLLVPLTKPWVVSLAALYLLVLDPMLVMLFRGRYSLVVGMTLEGMLICIFTVYVVRQPRTLLGKVLNSRILRHIGVISYSLYLWQNVLTSAGARFFPLNLFGILICAELSYWAVEQPSLRIRDRISKKRKLAITPVNTSA